MKILRSFYKEYGLYINKYRAIPFTMDGLRPVERRVLLAGYNVAKKMIKSANVVGNAIVLHPHGESSIYSALVRLVSAGLFDGQGNWGSNFGSESWPAAAMRYTECKLNDEIKKIVFSHIDYVPKEKIEHLPEPKYLPTPIPLCFILDNPNTGIGFGVQTSIPKYKIKDLFKHLIKLINTQNSTISPYFPNNKIIKEKSQINELLTKGSGYITYQAEHEIIANKRKIIIRGVPVKGFTQLNKVMDQYFQKKIITWEDLSRKNKTEIGISVIKNKKCDFDKLKNDILKCITNKITYNIYLTDENDKIKLCPVNELLLSVYKRYKNDTINHIKSDIDKIDKIIDELTKILLLRPHVGEISKSKVYNIIEITKVLANKVNHKISESEIESLLNKYSVTKLLTIKIEIDKYKEEKSTLEYKIKNIDSVLLDEMNQFHQSFK